MLGDIQAVYVATFAVSIGGVGPVRRLRGNRA